MNKIELKPCPFCGGEATFRNETFSDPVVEKRQLYGRKFLSNYLKQNYRIECKKCKFSTRGFTVLVEIEDKDGLRLVGDFYDDQSVKRAADEWNRRTSQ